MNEQDATRMAELLQGFGLNAEAFNSGGNVWLTIVTKPDNTVVVFGNEGVGAYDNLEHVFENDGDTPYISLV